MSNRIPTAAAVAAVVIVGAGVGFGVGFAGYGSQHTTTVSATASRPATTTAPTTAPPATPQPITLVGGQVCVQGQGATSLINVTVYGPSDVSGSVDGTLSPLQGGQPGSPISGQGTITAGEGTIPFTIGQFGTYGNLALTGPSLGTVSLGPLAAAFPFTVSSDTQACTVEGAQVPGPARTTTTPSTPLPPAAPTVITSTTTATTRTRPWSLLAIPGAVLVAGGVVAVSWDDDDDEEEDDEEEGEEEVDEEEPCACGLQLSIQSVGHDDEITACTCGSITYGVTPADERTTTLEVAYNDGGESACTFYSQQFEADVTPQCEGGGTVRDLVYHWSANPVPPPTGGSAGYIELTVEVRATLVCPGKPQRIIVESDSLRVTLYEARPTVQVIHRRPDPDNPHDFGHASLRVRCGSMDLLFGYYPPNASVEAVLLGEAAAKAGVEAGGVGLTHNPPVGENYAGLKSKFGYDVYTLTCDCTQLEKIMAFWNNLLDQSQRGTIPNYALLWNNCATVVMDSLHAAGIAENTGTLPVISPSDTSVLADQGLHQFIPGR